MKRLGVRHFLCLFNALGILQYHLDGPIKWQICLLGTYTLLHTLFFFLMTKKNKFMLTRR